MRAPHLCIALLALAPACGSVPSFPDGGGSDGASPDAASPDAVTRGLVKVSVADPGTGTPTVGVSVVFQDPDGSVVARVVTNGQGKAEAEVLPGGRVTSVVPGNNQYSMETVEGVKPGDDLLLNYFSSPRDYADAGTFAVSYGAYSGASSYVAYGPCGSVGNDAANPLSATLTFQNNCKRPTMEVIVVARDSQGMNLAFLDKGNVAFVNGGATAMGSAWQPMKTLSATFSNLPAEVTSARVSHYVPNSAQFSVEQIGTPTAGAVSLSLSTITGTTASIATQLNNTGGAFQQSTTRVAGNSLSFNFDGSTGLLPWIDPATFDPATGSLTVTTHGGNLTPDGVVVQLGYQRPIAFGAQGGSTTTSFTWIVFRPTMSDFTLPTLPAEVGDIAPRATDTPNGLFAVAVEADVLDGYDGLRAVMGQIDQVVGQDSTAQLVHVSFGGGLR